MPNRIVRDAILSSERVASLGWAEEVLFRRLMSIVDDYGRHEANPKLVRSKCYPMQTDEVTVDLVCKWLRACQKAGLILLYQSGGKEYLELVNFGQQIRAASKCPAPDSNCSQVQTDAHLGVAVSEVVSVAEVVKDSCPVPQAAAEPEPSVIVFPLNTGVEWGFSEDRFHEYRGLYPQVDVMAELRKMRGWFIANPAKRKTKTGILRFINSWLSKAQDENRPGTFRQADPAPSKRMQALQRMEELKHGGLGTAGNHHGDAATLLLGARSGAGFRLGGGNGSGVGGGSET
jgi:hypothetical protein